MRALLIEKRERIYAEVRTPSGGAHYYIQGHPDLPTVHSKKDDPKLPDFPGLDIQSHGANVFWHHSRCAPSTAGAATRSCATNSTRYRGDRRRRGGADPLTEWVAEQLACNVKAKARKTSGGAREWDWDKSQPWDGTPPDKRAVGVPATRRCAGEADKVAKTAKGGRNDALFAAALKLGSYIAGAGSGRAEGDRRPGGRPPRPSGCTAEDRRAGRPGPPSGRGCAAGRSNPRAVPQNWSRLPSVPQRRAAGPRPRQRGDGGGHLRIRHPDKGLHLRQRGVATQRGPHRGGDRPAAGQPVPRPPPRAVST